MPVKNKIKEFVNARGLSVYAFRKAVGCSATTAYDLYHDPWQLPSSTVLTKICDAFRVQPTELLEWIAPEDRPEKAQKL